VNKGVGGPHAKNPGREFLGCPNFKDDDKKCGYFLWYDEWQDGKDWVPRTSFKRSRPAASSLEMVSAMESKLQEAYDQLLDVVAAMEARMSAMEAKVSSKPISIHS
jgi:hypothetical protein